MAALPPVPDFDCVVFGATGDLTLRKLLPALYSSVSRQQFDSEEPHHRLGPQQAGRRRRIASAPRPALREHVAKAELDEDTLAAFLQADPLRPTERCDRAKAGTGW